MDMNTSRTELLNDLHYMVSRRDRPAKRVLTDIHKNGKLQNHVAGQDS
jgi:hypothetical protein